MPLTFNELRIGMKVQLPHARRGGRAGTIVLISKPTEEHRLYKDGFFTVKWDNGEVSNWKTAEYFEEIDNIINKDMKCSDCNLPSPHAKTNLPDDKYVCDVCKIMRDLS